MYECPLIVLGNFWKRDRLVMVAATYNTQQTPETNIHSLRGIQTRSLRHQAAANLRLRSHGHRDKLGLLPADIASDASVIVLQ
jgi:hypothetical protein